ncbi:hypothetical protein Mp_7g00780 [Marchantia polymorpha subsp. ruderalis]|uniref:Uncharacterized protein n=2 Tax=Marchantia polymorpha TaxID=3197 RepID=A0AAF6BUU8_MARPO|nr:hypothetical protein MARPO_0046s0046 [Marchantia polymorpha]BBN15782.1 hypothetical protein Mp_7g00780 [Marchantia polymorpha subsp. ruderalis]|eukprot:PTQ39224.1 hypothetical protein MARPO_0046s0046 [Marchantia polymorpha]
MQTRSVRTCLRTLERSFGMAASAEVGRGLVTDRCRILTESMQLPQPLHIAMKRSPCASSTPDESNLLTRSGREQLTDEIRMADCDEFLPVR